MNERRSLWRWWQRWVVTGVAVALVAAAMGCATLPSRGSALAGPAPPAESPGAPAANPVPLPERPGESPPVLALAAEAPGVPEASGPALAAPPGVVAAAQLLPSPAARTITLNFDNADVPTVVRTLAQLLGINYILEPTVGPGRVTIHASGKFAKEELFPILETLLEVNNLTITRAGPLYRIGPLAEARQRPLEAYVGRQAVAGGDRVIVQVIPLSYLPASAMEGILKPLITKTGAFLPVPGTNSLVVVDLASSIGKLLEVIGLLDVNTFDRIQVRLYTLKHAEAETLARELEELFAQLGYGKTREPLRFFPIPRLGAILVINAFPELAPSIERWLDTLDQPTTEVDEGIFVYYVENAKAVNLADIFNRLYQRERRPEVPPVRPPPPPPPLPGVAPPLLVPPGGPVPLVPTPRTPRERPGREGRAEAPTPVVPGAPPVARPPAAAPPAITPAGEIRIFADEATNALIIAAPPKQYPAILETIKKLDIPKKQVLIETLVAELTLDDATQFGLEWSLRTSGRISIGGKEFFVTTTPTAHFGTLFTPQPSLLGFTSVVTATDQVLAMIRALSEANRINVLSSPNILATDNRPAVINIGDSIPILTSQTSTAPLTGGLENITQTIQYQDTGIILQVTAHINEKRMVVIDLRQEVSNAVPNVIGGTESPIIQKRTADTSVVVADGQTVLIGGLITEERSRTRTGIPGLARIPVLGYLFGSTREALKKRELIILITPRVVGDPDDAREITSQFERRVRELQQQIWRFR